ncbi:lipase [Lysinibacillus sp. PLM2]|nr:lipase [Lysinibacillus sp. PLM2]
MPIHSYILQHFEQFSDDRTNGIHSESPPNERRPDVFQIEDQQIDFASLHLPIRIYTPKDMPHYSLLVFLNGGEIISGDWESSDIACRMLASFSGYKVISIDYTPLLKKSVSATFDGSYAALKWITSNAHKFGGDHDNVSICGDSIGASLATSIIIQSIQTKDFILSNQLLFYPIIDFTNEVEKSEYLSRKMYNAKYGVDILKLMPLTTNLIPLSLLQTDKNYLSKMPKTLIFTAEYDPFCDEGELYAEKIKTAGTHIKHIRFDGNIHGFMQYFPGSPDYMRGYELSAEFLMKEEKEVIL